MVREQVKLKLHGGVMTKEQSVSLKQTVVAVLESRFA